MDLVMVALMISGKKKIKNILINFMTYQNYQLKKYWILYMKITYRLLLI